MRLSSLYKVTQKQGWCLHPEILTITLGNQLDAGHRGVLCLEAWGAGLEQGGFPES